MTGINYHEPKFFFLAEQKCVSLYMDYKLDESYTPSKVAVRAGTNFHDLTVSPFLVGFPDPMAVLKHRVRTINCGLQITWP